MPVAASTTDTTRSRRPSTSLLAVGERESAPDLGNPTVDAGRGLHLARAPVDGVGLLLEPGVDDVAVEGERRDRPVAHRQVGQRGACPPRRRWWRRGPRPGSRRPTSRPAHRPARRDPWRDRLPPGSCRGRSWSRRRRPASGSPDPSRRRHRRWDCCGSARRPTCSAASAGCPGWWRSRRRRRRSSRRRTPRRPAPGRRSRSESVALPSRSGASEPLRASAVPVPTTARTAAAARSTVARRRVRAWRPRPRMAAWSTGGYGEGGGLVAEQGGKSFSHGGLPGSRG